MPQTRRSRAEPPAPRDTLQVKPRGKLSGADLIERRNDPNSDRKKVVRERTQNLAIDRPLELHNAVSDIAAWETFGLSTEDKAAVLRVTEIVMNCLHDHLNRKTTFKKNIGILRYDERLYLFLKALMSCVEYANQSNNKPTEDQKLTFIEGVSRAIEFLRNAYKPPAVRNPLRG